MMTHTNKQHILITSTFLLQSFIFNTEPPFVFEPRPTRRKTQTLSDVALRLAELFAKA